MQGISAAASPRVAGPSYPWLLIGLLWLVAFLNAADRSILIAVMPQLRSEFGLTPTELALLNSVFFWIYAVTAFLAGRLGDSARRTRVIIYGLVFWSVATGFSSLANGFAMLLAFRGLVAFGEAFYYPTATALISDWHQPAMRSRALSIHQTAVLGGAGLGALFAGFLADRLGWQAPFAIFGTAGRIYSIVLFRALRDKPRPEPTEEKGKKSEPIKTVLGIKPALMLCVIFFLGTGASTGVTVWAPTYIYDTLGLDLAGSALYGSLTINMASLVAVPLGGFIADMLAKKTPIGRFYTLMIGLGSAGILLLPLLGAHTAVAVAVVLIATSFGKGIFDGCIYASMHDVVPPQARATAVGMMTMIGFFGAGITPIFVAQVGERFGMAIAMTSLAALYFIAVVILFAMRGATRRAVLANAHEAGA
jgi:MFS family permease